MRKYNKEVMTRKQFEELYKAHGDNLTIMVTEKRPFNKVRKAHPFRKNTQFSVLIDGRNIGRVMSNVFNWYNMSKRYNQLDMANQLEIAFALNSFWRIVSKPDVKTVYDPTPSATKALTDKDINVIYENMEPRRVEPQAAEPDFFIIFLKEAEMYVKKQHGQWLAQAASKPEDTPEGVTVNVTVTLPTHYTAKEVAVTLRTLLD